ncbi:hypothetical protein, partial [Bartonella sp. TT110JLCBS]|uniref:hypothetical protein n=1 Tax=Bartonella sp. TT110JLCBS TaxID=3243578 RepID=UPI0035CEE354
LINLGGSSVLSFGENSEVDLQTTGAGVDAIINVKDSAKITIYKPEYVIFDLQSTGSGSKIFNFSGEVDASYVKIRTSSDGDYIGPYKTVNYTLTK